MECHIIVFKGRNETLKTSFEAQNLFYITNFFLLGSVAKNIEVEAMDEDGV